MLKKLIIVFGILTSVSLYSLPTLNVYDFEIKKDKEASYKTITENYINKTLLTEEGVLGLFATTDERDKMTSYIFEVYSDYLSFAAHTKNEISQEFKVGISQIAEGNLNNTEIEVQMAKDKKIEQNDDIFIVYTVIDVKAENNKEFTEIIKKKAETTFSENGNLLIYVGTDRRNPNKWCLFEVYSDIDSYLNHRASDYFKNYITQTKDIIVEQKRYELQPLKLINKGGLNYKRLY
ncbi:antibiotic biosynthesis monooxygenase [Fusobacterium nucleatum]|uniref:antibiotic biosynthesis monooxygenase n=1 Tax=Fusobacterium nucleatum TaxID=851 RepID=UPI003CFE6D31